MALVLVGPVNSYVAGGPPVDISDKFAGGTPKPMLTRFADATDGSPQFSAVTWVCTHRGCDLLTGSAQWNTTPSPIYDSTTKVITCPCHGSMFNVQTGAVVGPPAHFPLTVYAVKIQGTDVYVDNGSAPQNAGVA